MNFLYSGGQPIKNSNIGDGTDVLRAFTSKDVEDIYQALLKIEISELKSRYHSEKMVKMMIYPSDGYLKNGNVALDDLLLSFESAIDFLKDAVAVRMGMIVHIG